MPGRSKIAETYLFSQIFVAVTQKIYFSLECFKTSSSPYYESEKWKQKSFNRVWLCNPMDYRVHGILQARILEWVAFLFSRGSSQPRDRTQVSYTAGISGWFFTNWATREALGGQELYSKQVLLLKDSTRAQVAQGVPIQGPATQWSWSWDGKSEPEPTPRAFPEARQGKPSPGIGLSFRIMHS